LAGAANKNIAEGLGLDQRTVEGYRDRFMEKVQARNVSDL
jgi:FixJ family two-component response regulator